MIFFQYSKTGIQLKELSPIPVGWIEGGSPKSNSLDSPIVHPALLANTICVRGAGGVGLNNKKKQIKPDPFFSLNPIREHPWTISYPQKVSYDSLMMIPLTTTRNRTRINLLPFNIASREPTTAPPTLNTIMGSASDHRICPVKAK